MDKRSKALQRLVVLRRIAGDERSPQGERDAATARAETITLRYAFTDSEVAAAQPRDEVAERRAARASAERWERQFQERMRRQAQAAGGAAPRIIVVGESGAVFEAVGGVFTFGQGEASPFSNVAKFTFRSPGGNVFGTESSKGA